MCRALPGHTLGFGDAFIGRGEMPYCGSSLRSFESLMLPIAPSLPIKRLFVVRSRCWARVIREHFTAPRLCCRWWEDPTTSLPSVARHPHPVEDPAERAQRNIPPNSRRPGEDVPPQELVSQLISSLKLCRQCGGDEGRRPHDQDAAQHHGVKPGTGRIGLRATLPGPSA
jgi:hypothetical protein